MEPSHTQVVLVKLACVSTYDHAPEHVGHATVTLIVPLFTHS
ncbi:MAG: hypothetical protein WCL02_08025 [bacterium]